MAHTGIKANIFFLNERFLYRKIGHISVFLRIASAHSGVQTRSVSSPNSGLTIKANQDVVSAISPNKNCYCRFLLGAIVVIDWSPLGVTTSDQNFVMNLTVSKDSQATVHETYSLPAGKRSVYGNHCNELTLTFANANNCQTSFSLRVYDDAAAFRYELYGTGATVVTGEISGFTLPVTVSVSADNIRLSLGERITVTPMISGPLSVTMVDLKGTTVYSQRNINSRSHVINSARMQQGVYLIKVLSGSESTVRRVVLK